MVEESTGQKWVKYEVIVVQSYSRPPDKAPLQPKSNDIFLVSPQKKKKKKKNVRCDAHERRLAELLLMSTHNVYFHEETRKKYIDALSSL